MVNNRKKFLKIIINRINIKIYFNNCLVLLVILSPYYIVLNSYFDNMGFFFGVLKKVEKCFMIYSCMPDLFPLYEIVLYKMI